jgi:hypothetical protein
VRLYVNFFQPSLKLRQKERDGGRVRKRYDAAQTPCRRLLARGVLPADGQVRLQTIAATLDPVALLGQISQLQAALWQHAVFRGPVTPLAGRQAEDEAAAVRFAAAACGLGATPAGDGTQPAPVPAAGPRKYHRSRKLKAPRTYRTRVDPFAEVWPEVEAWLTADPTRTGKGAFQELQRRYPGRYTHGQLRTLQRRVAEWRARAVVTFDDGWLAEERLGEAGGLRPLRVVPLAEVEGDPVAAEGTAAGTMTLAAAGK